MKITRKRMGIILKIIAVLLIVSLTGMYFLARNIYDSRFGKRFTTSAKDSFDLSAFETLSARRYIFPSNRGQQLAGYLYEHKDPELRQKGVIVFAHGFGAGGQNGYMDIFDFLTRQGFRVFAYDATGNDESEGEKVGGLPQGYIDLDHAISFVQGMEDLQGLPIGLMGYSWGALSVMNVLNVHPEAAAVVALAGCNRSMDLIEYHGVKMAGKAAKWLIPFAWLHEYLMYGRYACCTALKGFEKSDCRVMIVHGAQDRTVPTQYGYDAFYEKYAADERFVFKKYENRDHDVMNLYGRFRDAELLADIAAFFDRSMKTEK